MEQKRSKTDPNLSERISETSQPQCAGPSPLAQEESYLASVKLQKDFLDQNSNATKSEDTLTFDKAENEVDSWGIWTPETQKYWRLQYSAAKRALDSIAVERNDDEDQRSHGEDVAILLQDNDRSDCSDPKKFQGDHSGARFPGKPPPSPQRHNQQNLRRVTFWMCSMPTQPVVAEYDDPVVRARFVTKVLLLKAAQLVIILAAILAMFCDKRLLVQFHRRSVLPIWVAAVVYVMLLLSIKASLIGVTKMGAGVCLFLQTFCVIEICFTIVSISEPYIVPCVLTILILTYVVIAAFSVFLTLDLLNSNNLFGLTWVLVLVASIGIVGAMSHYIPKLHGRSLAGIIGHYWIPTLLCSETVVLLTLSELYQILQGNRIPLLTVQFDWIQAAAQLY